MKFSWARVFMFAGAIVASLTGSGFASGQEALQFLTCYGLRGCVGGLVFTVAIYLCFSYFVMSDGYELQLPSQNDIYKYYCGKKLGLFFEIYTPIFLFSVYVVMLSGAGAIVSEYYGLAPIWGRGMMAILTVCTVLLGLDNLVKIVSKIGPCIILFTMIVGVGGLVINPEGIFEADAILKTITVTKASKYWFVSGLIFPSMGCVMFTPFLASLSKTAHSKKEAAMGGLMGGATFGAAISIFALGLLANIGQIYDKNIPALVIADQISPLLGGMFSVILLSGIYTAAVPMLWFSSNRLAQDEKSVKFKKTAVLLMVIAFVFSRFPFAVLVNVLYTITGYVGVLLVGAVFIKNIKKRCKTRL